MKKILTALLVILFNLVGLMAMAEEPTRAQLDEFNALIKSGHNTKAKLEVYLQQIRPISHADVIPKGWTVVENVVPSLSKVSGLELVSYLNKGEDYIDSNEMRERAKQLKANLGLDDAIYLLEHQDKIPVEMQDKFLIFPGTFLRGPGGGLCVPYLHWLGGRWFLRFDWLGRGWCVGGRLVCGK